jgi:quinoprotein glucose dehydrogenase
MNRLLLLIFSVSLIFSSCKNESESPSGKHVKQLNPDSAVLMAKAIENVVTPELAEGLTMKLWGVDSLVADPVGIDVDDQGRLYYTRTNRQKNSEFDIRGHQDWELGSIKLTSIDDKRKFLHEVLSPENSKKNEWLADLNKDGSHDWKDMTVEKEHVYRLEDTNGDGVADLSQLVIEDFNDEVTDAMGGIMKHGDDLFVNLGPDMWRLNDKNGDGVIDEKKSISTGYGIHVGFSGHGMSGIEVGPEGKIYWQIGDIGFNGGKGFEQHSNNGVIVRSNPDGSDFEVFAYGNRNTHEFVFDEYGNLISEDNDGDHPGESERIVYVVDGGDIGWRINWQFGKYRDPDNNTYKVWMDENMYSPRWDGQAAYFIPPIANFVNGPTGMLYNPGTALSSEWKNYFFIGEFVGNPSRSGIHGFKLNPEGAGFKMGEFRKVMSGVLATGIDWGPDGAMYLADWIDGWGTKDHGRVWKLDVANPNVEERKAVEALIKADFNDHDISKLSELLRHDDMRVRQKAQFELVDRGDDGLDALKKSLEQKEHQLARVHSIWGISQFARKDIKHGALLVPYLKDSDPEIRAQAAKWIGDVRYKDAGAELIPLLKDENARARFFAAEALGRTSHESAINPIVEMLQANDDKDVYLRHAGSLALARIGKADPVIALSGHQSKAVRLAAVLALRRMKDAGIKAFLNDSDEYIVAEAARAINDDWSIEGALADLGNALNNYKFTKEALIRRAINANLRVGTDQAMDNLINYAKHEGSPIEMRAEAIAALSTWAKPSVVDRVDGRYRGDIKRDPASVRSKSAAALNQLLSHKDASLRLQAVKAIGKLEINSAPELLVTRLKTDKDSEVRAEALKALAKIDYAKIGDAIKVALADKEKNVRVTGLDLLTKMNISKELMVTLLADVINTKTTEEKQAALMTLGTLPLENTQKTFEQLLTKLEAGKIPVEIDLELNEAIDSTKSQPLITRYKEITRKLYPDTLMGPYKGALLGGNPRNGGRLFYSHQTAQCLRCHSFHDQGGSAGPRLNGVAARLTRDQLLEALVNPSARIAPGFGIVTLELKNGKKMGGTLLEEKATTLLVKGGNKPDTLINKSDIAKRTDAASSMPPMRLLLTKREIRDLVAFLSTLKDED